MNTDAKFSRLILPVFYSSVCLLISSNVFANDFPTVDRALFIQECMALKHSHKYETLYACACTVDNIAEQMTYDEFVQADSYVRMRNMRGEKGGLFRGSDQAREIRKQFSEIKREAEAACFINQVQQESSSETPDSTISASSNIRKG